MSGLRKITIEIPEGTEMFDELQRVTERPNATEVVRDALEYYDLVVQQMLAGKRVFIGDDRKTAGEVRLPYLEVVQKYRKTPDEKKG